LRHIGISISLLVRLIVSVGPQVKAIVQVDKEFALKAIGWRDRWRDLRGSFLWVQPNFWTVLDATSVLE